LGRARGVRAGVDGLKRYSDGQIRKTLLKYETQEIRVELSEGEEEVRILGTEDAYALLDRLIEQERSQPLRRPRFPYWAEIWPASLGLSRYFIQYDTEDPRQIIKELGCGLGLVGIALARLGRRVEATDFVEDALVFASHNASKNQISALHRVSYLDWSHPVGRQTDCMVGADIAYETRNHPYLLRVIRKLLLPGGCLYLGDPKRPAAKPLIAALREQGFSHQCTTLPVTWKALDHEVDIHVLRKP